MHHFYSMIIGTELLNGRRIDKHFNFINQELTQRGLLHVANFVLNDNPLLIQNCFNTVLADPQSVLFCFGGIGATPDDLTRPLASETFTGQPLQIHKEAQKLIIEQFGDEAYPHRINMAKLPPQAKLLKNVVNNVPGFQLFDRFFFTPGFPSMAWPMVKEALDTFFPDAPKPYTSNFTIETNESELIDIMEQLPRELGFSSLPRFEGDKRFVEIYLSHPNKDFLTKWSTFFQESTHAKGKKIL